MNKTNKDGPRRILMLVENNAYPGDIRVRSEATALRDEGYRVAVISPARKGQRLREIVDGVHVYRFPSPPEGRGLWGYLLEYGYSTLALFVLSLWVALRYGFDVIHAANPPDTLVFIAAFYKLFGKRFIFDHHDLSPEMYWANFGPKGYRALHRVLVWLEKLSCRLADHIIATNESYKRVQMERHGIPERRITIVRNGPDMRHFRSAQADPALRPEGKVVIAYLGVMGAHDGLDHLLRALNHLVYSLGRTDFCCWLIGGQGQIEDLKILGARLRLEQYVHFTGWISETEKLCRLATADICVDPDPLNPLNDRSTMIKIAEYMAVGKPIVAFDLLENRYTAQEAAVCVPGNDEMAFAKAVSDLMDDAPRRSAMGAFARRRAEAELAWSRSVPKLLSVYHAIFGQDRLPSRATEGRLICRR